MTSTIAAIWKAQLHHIAAKPFGMISPTCFNLGRICPICGGRYIFPAPPPRAGHEAASFALNYNTAIPPSIWGQYSWGTILGWFITGYEERLVMIDGSFNHWIWFWKCPVWSRLVITRKVLLLHDFWADAGKRSKELRARFQTPNQSFAAFSSRCWISWRFEGILTDNNLPVCEEGWDRDQTLLYLQCQ